MCIASHIDTTTLTDGTYELVPESESEPREAQVNLTEAAEDPNQSSEEPKASFARQGKPRSMTHLSTCALNLKGVVWNLSCMILGTYI